MSNQNSIRLLVYLEHVVYVCRTRGGWVSVKDSDDKRMQTGENVPCTADVALELMVDQDLERVETPIMDADQSYARYALEQWRGPGAITMPGRFAELAAKLRAIATNSNDFNLMRDYRTAALMVGMATKRAPIQAAARQPILPWWATDGGFSVYTRTMELQSLSKAASSSQSLYGYTFYDPSDASNGMYVKFSGSWDGTPRVSVGDPCVVKFKFITLRSATGPTGNVYIISLLEQPVRVSRGGPDLLNPVRRIELE